MHYLSIVILVLFNGNFEWFLKFLRVSLVGELTRARENRLARGVATRSPNEGPKADMVSCLKLPCSSVTELTLRRKTLKRTARAAHEEVRLRRTSLYS